MCLHHHSDLDRSSPPSKPHLLPPYLSWCCEGHERVNSPSHERQGASQRGQASSARASWASPSFPLPSARPTPVGRGGDEKPPARPHSHRERGEAEAGVELRARRSGKSWLVLLAGCHQAPERAASQPHLGLRIKQAERPPSEEVSRRTPEEEKGSFERWDLRRGSDSRAQREMGSRGRPQARSPTVQRHGKRGEEGAWGWRRRTSAAALRLPPGRRGCHTSPAATSLEQQCGWVLACLEGVRLPSQPGSPGGSVDAIWVKNKRFLSLLYICEQPPFIALSNKSRHGLDFMRVQERCDMRVASGTFAPDLCRVPLWG